MYFSTLQANLTSNKQARESSLEEECTAICELHHVSNGAPLALQLKAIDQEFHDLLAGGKSVNADRVQELLAWKSKQATQVAICEICLIMSLVFFRVSVSGRCCLDGSSIHQPIFCCSSHSPDTSPGPVLDILLTITLWPSSVSFSILSAESEFFRRLYLPVSLAFTTFNMFLFIMSD